MKFGKHIQAHQVPGWSPYYLDYKALKRIISSLAANRPVAESAALASKGVRQPDPLNSPSTSASPSLPSRSPSSVLGDASSRPPLFSASPRDEDRGSDFQAHKAAFFFKLERELEKINAFYLQKEAELKLRLETLLSKRRAAAMRGLPDTPGGTTRSHVEWSVVEEGFRLLERDLGKLQQFIELNATGFRKILKKFDKRFTSTTKELYLTRQVDVQPVFNRQLISELSDTVAICLLDLTDLSSGLKFEGPAANDIFTQQIVAEGAHLGPFHDLESNLRKAVVTSDSTAIVDCVRFYDILGQQNGGKTNVTRILWNAIIEAPDLADLIMSSLGSPFDFHFIDDINGRTCLHTAAIAGCLRLVNLCIEKGVQVDKVDAYGRSALHYASMNGHPDVCCRLLEANLPSNTLDMDNYSPLVYATLKGSVECVRVLVEEGKVPVQPITSVGDLIPLSLASRSGHVAVVLFLLEHGAKCLPNSNGEYPMHLAAREGHVAVCKILLHQEGWDTPDKYHEWTPLFFAARYGHKDCIQVLLQAGSRVQAIDELGHLPVHYAAWYGHHECLDCLLEATAKSPSTAQLKKVPVDSPLSEKLVESEIDLIPTLSLPPPIMPHRVYGHNYLDSSSLVQVSLGHSSCKAGRCSGVRLHHRLISPVFKDEHLLASTPLKLVMTTTPDVNSAPYSISLPQRDENGTFAFQIPSLHDLSLEFSIYPNFGTKIIGRAIALPSLFTNVKNNQPFILPILDHRLHVVGEVSFEVSIIKPFDGVTLEVGGDVETYWKSVAWPIPAISRSPHSSWPHHSSFTAFTQDSPSNHTLTISSLKGNYVYVVVQVTRDLHPVVYADWLLPGSDFDLTVADVTLAQFEALAARLGRQLKETTNLAPSDWPTVVKHSMVPLADLMQSLPMTLGMSLELAYLSQMTTKRQPFRHWLDLNLFVDSVLRTIHHISASVGGFSPRRRIVFTAFSPDVCSFLNWKQPNYPVFFASQCGKKGHSYSRTALATEDEHDRRLFSLGAAVEFARVNNLLGVFVDADLLVQVPSLIQSIRNVGLLVGVHGVTEKSKQLTTAFGVEGNLIDAFLDDGMVVYMDHSTREPI